MMIVAVESEQSGKQPKPSRGGKKNIGKNRNPSSENVTVGSNKIIRLVKNEAVGHDGTLLQGASLRGRPTPPATLALEGKSTSNYAK